MFKCAFSAVEPRPRQSRPPEHVAALSVACDLHHSSDGRQPNYEKDQAEDQKEEKQKFRDSRGGGHGAGESEQRRYQSDD